MQMTKTDFFLAAAFTVSVAAIHKIYFFPQEPSVADYEARAKALVVKKGGDDSIITIYCFDNKCGQAFANKGLLDASSIVMYVELHCLLIGQPYTKVRTIPAEPRFRPRNKLPV